MYLRDYFGRKDSFQKLDGAVKLSQWVTEPEKDTWMQKGQDIEQSLKKTHNILFPCLHSFLRCSRCKIMGIYIVL